MDELKSSLLILVVLVAGFMFFSLLQSQGKPRAVFQTGTLDSSVALEIADNRMERRQGLMNRESLCQTCGMLFLYENSEERSFWMKNTSIPLDIIFISADQKVVNIEHADPEPNTSDSNLTVYNSGDPAKYVIEVNQGFAEEKNIERGTEVIFRSIPQDQ